MAKLDEELQMRFLESVLRIYSPSGSEGELSDYLRDKFIEFGYNDVRVDKAGNVLGELGEGDNVVLFCGHMDTIPGQLKVRVENGKIYGRGAVDAKSSLAAMIMAPLSIKEEMPCRVIVAAVTGEEGEGEGIKELVRSGVKGDCNIFGEPSGLRNITIGYRGKLAFIVKIKSRGGHPGAPWKFENAIEGCFDFLNSVRDELRTESRPQGHFYSASASPNMIRGGHAGNVMPDFCEMYVDVRIPPSMSTKRAVELVGLVRERYMARTSSEVELEFSSDYVEPYETDRASLSLRALMRAILEVAGGPIRLLKKTGTGDMNVFAMSTGRHAVSYGPGNPSLSHTKLEFVEIDEYFSSIKVLSNTIKQFSHIARTRV